MGAAFAVTVAGLLGCETSPPPAGSQTYAEVTQEGYCYARKKVDVLMVVDDSVSMGVFRPLWVANLSSFINVLEAEDVDANYRIAVTTSSVTGPGCADGNDGRLVFASCVANLDSLTGGPDLDGKAVDLAPICSETCDAASLDAPRPWLAYVDGIPNVEIATSMAMTCAGQLPVGCPYEQPLEAMKMAIDRMHDVEDPAFGFMRDDAELVVVFVTDEDDCSIQDVDAFFSVANEAPSAVCWRAGASCTPTENGLLDCIAATQGEGGPLHDLDRYFRVLDVIEGQKKRTDPDQEVIVSVVGGVPNGYKSGNAELIYAPVSDTDERQIGVGPGCTYGAQGLDVRAYPPLRLREFAERYNTADDPSSQRNLYSICADDYSVALEPVANAIRDQVRPGCFQSCVADVDDDVPGLQPECRVFEEDGRRRKELPPCEAGELPQGEVACFILKTGEDMAQECIDDGWNLELELVRDSGAPPSDGNCVEITCAASTRPEEDCADLD